MLNTRKLLYILPDVAYVAELLPTKKEHIFAIQAFRQINGDFLNEDDDLIAENIEKLFSKIEPETYHLILPDFLFTNTILEIKDTQESKVKQHIKEELLPSLELSKATHEIETFILTQYGNVTKIQLTALEKEVVAPVAQSAANFKVHIENISPLSWTIKSVISLEPSISVVQIGSTLFTAEHYIGVDQCTMAKVDEIENVGETIKTLKGAQPSIQTIYLMTNSLVEEKLKELVSSTLPIQQLAIFKEEESQMPSYVKQIIESGMKTIDISDYPVPSFTLPKVEAVRVTPMPTEKPRTLNVFDEDDADQDSEPNNPALPLTPEPETEELPAPTPVPQLDAPEPRPSLAMAEPVAELEARSSDELDEDANMVENVELDELDEFEETNVPEPERVDNRPTTSTEPKIEPAASPKREVASTTQSPQVSSKPPVIKNKGNSAWFKMLVTFLTVFLVTVAAGAGLTYLVLRVTGQIDTEQTVAASPTPSPTVLPSPSPSPSPVPTVEKGELSILVVNATTKAGYAGGTRAKLEDAGYKTVKAANAKGDYDPGIYVLTKTDDSALVSALEADSGLTLVVAEGYATEDAAGTYDAIIVLAQ